MRGDQLAFTLALLNDYRSGYGFTKLGIEIVI